ncbi:hypothetical protein C7U68_37425 [Bradyrhizobium sp. WBAH33]|nr:hypothetical protein [Bradyrhizobium sp. WBAH33]
MSGRIEAASRLQPALPFDAFFAPPERGVGLRLCVLEPPSGPMMRTYSPALSATVRFKSMVRP